MLGLQRAVAGQQGFFQLRDVSQPGDWERRKEGLQEKCVCVCFVCACMCKSHPSSRKERAFPGGAVDKNLPANAGDTGSIPRLGRFQRPWSN